MKYRKISNAYASNKINNKVGVPFIHIKFMDFGFPINTNISVESIDNYDCNKNYDVYVKDNIIYLNIDNNYIPTILNIKDLEKITTINIEEEVQ